MTLYAKHTSTRNTPQTEAASPKQVKNSAGGFTFAIDKWGRLDRWLILGAEGGSYYASERKLTKENAQTILACLRDDGLRTVKRIVEISDTGRAPKNDPAIFALALCAADENPATRKTALDALGEVCRIGTHLFQFVQSVKEFRGWGRALREAVCKWYLEREEDQLAYQVVKYQNRNGFSHRDVLRLAGGALADYEQSQAQMAVFRWIVCGPEYGKRVVARKGGKNATYPAIALKHVPKLLSAYEEMKVADSSKKVVKLIQEHRMTHEMVPSQWKNDPQVWDALLQDMPIGALVRNLGKLSNVGLLKPLSKASKLVAEKLTNKTFLEKARIHPLGILVALNTYNNGKGVRGSLQWEVVPQISQALDDAFYLSFGTIMPTGKRRLIALDVSWSMTWNEIANMPGITPRVGSAAMAMTTVRTEENYHVVAFSSGHGGISSVNITKKQALKDVIGKIESMRMGGTDCALPMIWAKENNIEVDSFEIYTDNETWAGRVHPHQALKQYRQKSGINAKCVVVGMVANKFTIADPDDGGMLDVVGFDTAAPSVMSTFIKEGF